MKYSTTLDKDDQVPMTQTTTRYAAPARILHWVVAVLVTIQFYFGWASEQEADRDASFALIQLHFQLGMTILALMLLRILWRIARPAPTAEPGPRWQRRAATATHFLLYALLFVLPLTGYVIWVWMEAPRSVFGLFDVPALFTPPADDETGRAIAWYIHHYSAYTLAALAFIHIAAAFWHEFWLSDRLIRRRML